MVMAKFSVRTVPDMSLMRTQKLVIDYVNEYYRKRKSQNKITVRSFRGSVPLLTDVKTKNFECAMRAAEMVWAVKPDATRDGATIPAASWLEHYVERDVVLIPMGTTLDYPHECNEIMPIINFRNGIRTFVAYMYELASVDLERVDDLAARQAKRRRRRQRWD